MAKQTSLFELGIDLHIFHLYAKDPNKKHKVDQQPSILCSINIRLQSAVKRWPHTPVSVGSIPAAESVFFYLLAAN